ncbi:ATP-binding protein [Cellulomonas denverensis]|uniref:ATP-binding protein n=1 Tax=Cellulomonas denverensis TaxID=264297 RepID=A0A7X6QYE2_9CELL|nr:ATP-binding protein [Cellulomonas denverensis]
MVLVCGPAGAGKSTHAARLAEQGYLWLSFDRIAWELGHREHPLDPDTAGAVHAIIRQRLLAAVAAGERVVVDTSFWSRAARDDYRALLAPTGVVPVVHHLRASEATMRARVAARSGDGPDDVPVPADRMSGYLRGFEAPTVQEGPVRVISTE